MAEKNIFQFKWYKAWQTFVKKVCFLFEDTAIIWVWLANWQYFTCLKTCEDNSKYQSRELYQYDLGLSSCVGAEIQILSICLFKSFKFNWKIVLINHEFRWSYFYWAQNQIRKNERFQFFFINYS